MVTVLVRGGLGNQMFEYATGLSVARRNGTRLLLDTTILRDRTPLKERTFRNLDLDVFTLTPEVTALSKISSTIPVWGLWAGIDMVLVKLRDMVGVQKIIKEKKDQIFDKEFFDAAARAHGNVYLWGFWQTPKYFEGIENELRDAFRFKYPFTGEAAAIAEKVAKTNSVSLHVRRADYLLAKYKGLYGDTNLDYYRQAVAYFVQNVKDPKFFVFSDDIAWCRDNLKLPPGAMFVDRSSEGPKASFHLHLMSLCKHNIIANSSFSWWGAWLNQNPGKTVIAPKQWSIATNEPLDIVPDGWIKM